MYCGAAGAGAGVGLNICGVRGTWVTGRDSMNDSGSSIVPKGREMLPGGGVGTAVPVRGATAIVFANASESSGRMLGGVGGLGRGGGPGVIRAVVVGTGGPVREVGGASGGECRPRAVDGADDGGSRLELGGISGSRFI